MARFAAIGNGGTVMAHADDSNTNGADANGWNVYRMTGDARITEFLGSAPTEHQAARLARSVGGDQIQQGLDGRVEIIE